LVRRHYFEYVSHFEYYLSLKKKKKTKYDREKTYSVCNSDLDDVDGGVEVGKFIEKMGL
jgi:hypothetical protein